MIELSGTHFRCHACGSEEEVKNIALLLNGRRMDTRLCNECRKQLKRML